MSQENIEIARTAFDAMNAFMRNDPGGGVALAEVLDPEMRTEWNHDSFGSSMDFIRWLQAVREPLDEVTLEPDEFIARGEHEVVVPFTARLIKGDGSEVPARVAWTLTIRDAAIERLCMFRDKGEALHAAGLRE